MQIFLFLWLQLFSRVCRASTGSPPRKNCFVSWFLLLTVSGFCGLVSDPRTQTVNSLGLRTMDRKHKEKKKTLQNPFHMFLAYFFRTASLRHTFLLSPSYDEHWWAHCTHFAHVISLLQLLFRAPEPLRHTMRCGERPHQGTLRCQVNKGTFISRLQPGKNHGIWGLSTDSCWKVNRVFQKFVWSRAYLRAIASQAQN